MSVIKGSAKPDQRSERGGDGITETFSVVTKAKRAWLRIERARDEAKEAATHGTR